MSGLSGVSTKGVGQDIVSYLKEVAEFFGITIRVTSGYRDPDAQAEAMFDNWINLKRGAVYKTTTLPVADRTKLDEYWNTAHGKTETAQQKDKSKADFLELAKAKVGSKSMHSRGRAIDVARTQIDHRVYRAITMHLHEVKEGTRKDIYHFESLAAVPTVDETTRTLWQDLDNASLQMHLAPRPQEGVWC